MNKHENQIDSTPIDNREWQAQERALQEERLHLTGDPRLAAYRQVARVLRQPLPDALPADFARRLAAQVGQVPLDMRFEQRLVRGLALALGLSGAIVAAMYGQAWLSAILAALPASVSGVAAHWLLALVACVGVSWGFDQVRNGTHPHAA